jgi:hypothetical protein
MLVVCILSVSGVAAAAAGQVRDISGLPNLKLNLSQIF